MRRWLTAAGGVALAAAVVVACAQHAPESPSTVGSGPDANAPVKALDESPGPVFPSMGPVPTNPNPGGSVPTQPSPSSFPTQPSPRPISTSPSPGQVPTSPVPGDPLPGPNPSTNPGPPPGNTPPGTHPPPGNTPPQGPSPGLTTTVQPQGGFSANAVKNGFATSPVVPYTDQPYSFAGGVVLNPTSLIQADLIKTAFADRTKTADPSMKVSFTLTNLVLGTEPAQAVVNVCVYTDSRTLSGWLRTKGFQSGRSNLPDLKDPNGNTISRVFEYCLPFRTGTSGNVDLGPPQITVPPDQPSPPAMMFFVGVFLVGDFATLSPLQNNRDQR